MISLEDVAPVATASLQEDAPKDATWWTDATFHGDVEVLAILLAVLAGIFWLAKTPFKAVYKFLPILLFCYFVPTALSNTGIIPGATPEDGTGGYSLYNFIKSWLLPASLLLMILSVDLIGILKMGKQAGILFLTAVVSIVIGGPLALLTLGWWLDLDAPGNEDIWKGLAALSGSWIGGGANFTSIAESVGGESKVTDAMLGVIIVVDVAVANVWMGFLLYFAGRNKSMDEKLGADSSKVDAVREKAEAYAKKHAKPTDLPGLLAICALAFGGTVLATHYATELNDWMVASYDKDHFLRQIFSKFTWVVLLVTGLGVALSFTPLRRLEGVGASKVGSVFLYLLVASIGAKADFAKVAEPQNIKLVAVGAVWMLFHAIAMLTVRRMMKAPIFFAAVGSKSCIGGAASAPVVAAAFHPSLAPVGALLAIGGYVCGTFGGLACAAGLQWVFELYT